MARAPYDDDDDYGGDDDNCDEDDDDEEGEGDELRMLYFLQVSYCHPRDSQKW